MRKYFLSRLASYIDEIMGIINADFDVVDQLQVRQSTFLFRINSLTQRCFITTTFKLCFKIHHLEDPRKPNGTYQLLVYVEHKYHKENTKYHKEKFRSSVRH
jgi:hypothetical protein